jgi:hypothetical protein
VILEMPRKPVSTLSWLLTAVYHEPPTVSAPTGAADLDAEIRGRDVDTAGERLRASCPVAECCTLEPRSPGP